MRRSLGFLSWMKRPGWPLGVAELPRPGRHAHMNRMDQSSRVWRENGSYVTDTPTTACLVLVIEERRPCPYCRWEAWLHSQANVGISALMVL